jgi:hypothetical protein
MSLVLEVLFEIILKITSGIIGGVVSTHGKNCNRTMYHWLRQHVSLVCM